MILALILASGVYIPPNAIPLLPVLGSEQRRLWPDHPKPSILAGQIEQESCVSLKNSRCWSSKAELKTKREWGFGLGQFTIAYNADGSERFNTWKELRKTYSKELASWTWENRLDPVLGLRAFVLYDYQLYRSARGFASDSTNAVRFGLAAYNGGLGGLLSDIRLCKARSDCNPRVWYNQPSSLGVESTSNKSRQKWHGYGQSAFEINRGYVKNIEQRAIKYELVAW